MNTCKEKSLYTTSHLIYEYYSSILLIFCAGWNIPFYTRHCILSLLFEMFPLWNISQFEISLWNVSQLQNMMRVNVICTGTLSKYPLKNRKITNQSCCHKIHLSYKYLIEILSTIKSYVFRVRHVSVKPKIYNHTLIPRVLFSKVISCTWEKSNITATLNSGTLKLRVKHSFTYFFWILMWSINITAPCDDNWELESIKNTCDSVRKHIPVKICTFLLINKPTNTCTVITQISASPYKCYWIKLSVFLSNRQGPPAFSAC